jgi:outer membrane protein assembly factor BamB
VTVETLVRLYDAQGNQLWTKQFGSPGNSSNLSSYVYAVAADVSGVYVAGTFTTGTYLRKYDTRGAELWTKQFENNRAFAYPMVVAAGPSGIYFGQNDDKTVFLRKFDASGTEIWTHQVDGQYLTGVTANATALYVTGFSTSGRSSAATIPAATASGSMTDRRMDRA